MTCSPLFALSHAGCTTTAAPQRGFFADLSSCAARPLRPHHQPARRADDSFAGKRLVMHVRKCSTDTIHVPFHVADDIAARGSSPAPRPDSASSTTIATRRVRRQSHPIWRRFDDLSLRCAAIVSRRMPHQELLIREGNTAGATMSGRSSPSCRTFATNSAAPTASSCRVRPDQAVPAPPPPCGSH